MLVVPRYKTAHVCPKCRKAYTHKLVEKQISDNTEIIRKNGHAYISIQEPRCPKCNETLIEICYTHAKNTTTKELSLDHFTGKLNTYRKFKNLLEATR